MNPAPFPPALLAAELRATAPGLARRLAPILFALAALIARAFLRDPRRVGLIRPLWSRLTRAAGRFERLMARLAAGTRPRQHKANGHSGPAPTSFPSRHAWLIHDIRPDLRHEAAICAAQLQALLSEPQNAALLAAAPTAAGILRPLCRMLGIRVASVPPLHPPAPQREATPHTPQPEPPNPHPPEPASVWHTQEPSLCGRLRTRWPFRQTKPD